MTKINPIYNVLHYCGIHVDHLQTEKVAKNIPSQSKHVQDGKIAQVKYKLNEFVNDISKSLSEINSNGEHKNIIYNKLKDRITKRQNKESQWGFIHRFFHRLGHLFRGHGFSTTAERAKIIQSKIEIATSQPLKNEETPKTKPNEEKISNEDSEKLEKPIQDPVPNVEDDKFKPGSNLNPVLKSEEEQDSKKLDQLIEESIPKKEVEKVVEVNLPEVNLLTKDDIKKMNVPEIWNNLKVYLEWPDNKKIREHLSKLTPDQIAEYVVEDVFQINLVMSVNWKPLTDLWNIAQKEAFADAILAMEDGIKLLTTGINFYVNYSDVDDYESYSQVCNNLKELDTFIDRTKFLHLFKMHCSQKEITLPGTSDWVAELLVREGLKGGNWAAIESSLKSYGLEEYIKVLPKKQFALMNADECDAWIALRNAQKEYTVSVWVAEKHKSSSSNTEIDVEKVISKPFKLLKSPLTFISKAKNDHSFAVALTIQHTNLDPAYKEQEAEYFTSDTFSGEAEKQCKKNNKVYLNSECPHTHQPFSVVAVFNESQSNEWHLTVNLATKGSTELSKYCSFQINHRNKCADSNTIFQFLTFNWTACITTIDKMKFFMQTQEQNKIAKEDHLAWIISRLINGKTVELDEREFSDGPVIGKWTVSLIKPDIGAMKLDK